MITREQIRSGFEHSEFYIEYMPTMSLSDNRCVGAEALLRWKHSDEIISPLEYIPVIEQTPLSGLITYWIIEEVARDLMDWFEKNEGIHIGINVPPEIIGRGGIEYAAIKSGLIRHAGKLVLEITERGFPDKLGLDTLDATKAVKVAIDDFGTGDANLLQLSQMKADIIKIDKYFIDQIKDPETVPGIVKGIAAFGLAMGYQMIAEGVELEPQAKVLKELGVHMAQGWFFSKPLGKDRFLEYYHDHQPEALSSTD
jgi:sensor c-di-GMP phosphodiesterase-like protein